ncbi:MAG: DUF3592 domain-containing protein [Deltaproteobacteria bacterium]
MLEPLMCFGGPVVLVLVIFAFLHLRLTRRVWGGFSLFERMRMRRVGLSARARVLDAIRYDGGIREVAHSEYHLVLEVTPESGEPYHARMTVMWAREKWDHLVVGSDLPVFVAPDDPQRVMMDYATLVTERRRAAASKATGGEARQPAAVSSPRP